jgi:hypothetical protein
LCLKHWGLHVLDWLLDKLLWNHLDLWLFNNLDLLLLFNLDNRFFSWWVWNLSLLWLIDDSFFDSVLWMIINIGVSIDIWDIFSDVFNNIIVNLFLFMRDIFNFVNGIILSESLFEWNIFDSRWSHLDLVGMFSDLSSANNSVTNNGWLDWHWLWSDHNLGLLNSNWGRGGDNLWSLKNLWSLHNLLNWSKLRSDHLWSHHHLWSDHLRNGCLDNPRHN